MVSKMLNSLKQIIGVGNYENWGDIGQNIQTCSDKLNEFWESNAQLGNCSQQYFIIYLKVAKSIDLKCSCHKKVVANMWGDVGFS